MLLKKMRSSALKCLVYKYSNAVLFHDCDYGKKWYSCIEQLIHDRLSATQDMNDVNTIFCSAIN